MKIYQLRPEFVLRTIAGESVLIPTGEAVLTFSGIFSMNESGALLSQALKNGATAAELAHLLCREYHLSADAAEADTAEFLSLLEKEKLIA